MELQGMRRHGRRRLAIGMALLGWVPLLGHAQAADDRPAQIERDYVTYVVNHDGSYEETHERVLRVIKPSALEHYKNSSISYSTSIEQVEVLEAYTSKADGRRIDVPKGNFQVDTRAGQAGVSPIYSDRTTMTVVFPELEAGDSTVLKYRQTATQAMFPGQFSVLQSYNPAQYYGDVRVVIDAPQDLVARHQGWHMQEQQEQRDGRRRIRWQWRNPKPVSPESLRDSTFEVGRYPGYAYTTFGGYAEIAQAYGIEANRRAAVTPRIQQLADQIAGDASTPDANTRKLYDWVASQISYAGNCIGLGAVVPRELDVVLDNRMGDCKDHATLLQALLKARGIDSTQALVNAGGVYALPDIPVASMVNHVITYVPVLDLYLDSTASTVPYRRLPAGVEGKPVLLVDGYRDDARTPVARSGEGQVLDSRMSIQPDGSVTGELSLNLRGRLAIAARQQFREMSNQQKDKLVRQYFKASGFKANGTIRHDDPTEPLEQFALTVQFQVEHMLPPSGGLPVEPWFFSLAPISGIVANGIGDDEEGHGESSCGGIQSQENYVFQFPANMQVASVPEDFTLQSAALDYRTRVVQQGGKVEISRQLDDRTPGPLCSADYNAAYARDMAKILPTLRRQIVYLQQ